MTALWFILVSLGLFSIGYGLLVRYCRKKTDNLTDEQRYEMFAITPHQWRRYQEWRKR